MKKIHEIQDFGKKIGGARKDLYSLENIDELTDVELSKVTRDKIWKKPDIEKELQAGTSAEALYFKETIRKALPPKPTSRYSLIVDPKDLQKAFIKGVNIFKDFCENGGNSFSELRELLEEHFDYAHFGVSPITVVGKAIACNKLVRLHSLTLNRMISEMKREQFGLNADEKVRDNFKKTHKIYHFSHVSSNKEEHISYPDEAILIPQKYTKERYSVLRLSRGRRYFYEGDDGFKPTDWEAGTYFIVNSTLTPIAKNLPSKEDAESAFNDLMESSVVFEKEARTKAGKKRKSKFSIPKLATIRQTDAVNFDITGQDYINVFGFSGGEFGNWLTDTERQLSLNYGFTAFRNLARVLNVKDIDMSLNGNMSIAFGARGRSSAAAHFEPDRNVINLTKFNGAGSLAHEWGHALDYCIGVTYGYTSLLSDEYIYKTSNSPRKDTGVPAAINNAFVALYIQHGKQTRYYNDSVEFDKLHSKEGGYWSSRCEMFARAFACYVEEKMKKFGMVDSYLSDHAFCFHEKLEDKEIYAIPVGEEKDYLFRTFDKMVDELKDIGILHSACNSAITA